MKRIVQTGWLPVLLVALLMLLSPAALGAELQLHDGRLKILILADIQDDAGLSPYTLDCINAALELEQPDLVILNGDNIHGSAPSLLLNPAAVRGSIAQFVEPITARGIPFAPVFGNHDPETILSKQAQMEHYQSFAGCLAEANPIGSSVGNYCLPVRDETGALFANLWFLDSNNHVRTEYGRGYAYVTEEQQAWYEQTSAALARENGGVPVPSLLFQHIPVPEIYDALTEVPEGTPGAVEGYGRRSGHYYILNDELCSAGTLGEGPCPPDVSSGQFDGWLRQGDVRAAFFGHDHRNDFVATVRGIDLVYTPGIGFYSYGNGYGRGVRVVELDQANPALYSTRMVYYAELSDRPIPEALLTNGEIGTMILQWALIALFALLALGLVVFLLIRRVRRRRRQRTQADA